MGSNLLQAEEQNFGLMLNFLPKKKQNQESLRQFWNFFMGLTAICEFGEQTKSLIMDAFIQNIHTKAVSERLCTKPEDQPQEALPFAIAFEGIGLLKSFVWNSENKKEPVFVSGKSENSKEPLYLVWI